MSKIHAIVLLLGAGALIPLAACGATGRPGISRNFNSYVTTVSATPDQAIEAAREVAHEMQLTEVMYSATPTEGKLIATSLTEKTFEFTTTREGDRVTELSVRVGNGERELSYTLIDKIKIKL